MNSFIWLALQILFRPEEGEKNDHKRSETENDS